MLRSRGKRIDNGEWVYGYYVKYETRQCCVIGDDKLADDEIIHLIARNSFADWNMPRNLEFVKVVKETVGQYTDLKDKNGMEIYKGDKTNKGVIEYWKGKYMVMMDNGQCHDDLCWCHADIEVIGNIYDTPSLIQEVI